MVQNVLLVQFVTNSRGLLGYNMLCLSLHHEDTDFILLSAVEAQES